jgi:hypothetical protein
MTRALERRAQRVLGIASDLLLKSRWTIWCNEPEHMPAMIDLLIAQGSLSESDRPDCVHWTAVRGEDEATRDDLARALDADEMLEKAGIRTQSGDRRRAWEQNPEAREAAYRKLLSEIR